MTASLRPLLLGIGIGIALVAGSTALAAPTFPKGPVQPTRKFPTPKPNPAISAGLKTTATLTPRALHDKGVSMNVHRAPRIEATANKVPMDKHTQLWLHFKAERNTEYDLSCQFAGRRSILTIDYAENRAVRQQSTTPSTSGRLLHKIYARSKTENVKVYMQANGDIDWRSCTVSPA